MKRAIFFTKLRGLIPEFLGFALRRAIRTQSVATIHA